MVYYLSEPNFKFVQIPHILFCYFANGKINYAFTEIHIPWTSLCLKLYIFTGLANGIVVEKFGCRKTAILGGCLMTIGLVGSSFGTSMVSLFLTLSVITGKSFNLKLGHFL